MNLFLSDKFQGSNAKLCFEQTEFHSDDFSIDEFIQRKRQVVPLDVLREDLGCYLKSLRSSLIELINHDYGQFVNLSSNLVGLDSQIYNITKPLKFVQQDFEALRDHLDLTFTSLKLQLQEKSTFHQLRSHLQYLRLAGTTLESAENYMKKISSVTTSTEICVNENFSNLVLLCSEVGQVQFLLEKCVFSSTFSAREFSPSLSDNVSPALKNLQSRYDVCSSFICTKLDYLVETYGNQTLELSAEVESKVKSVLHIYYELKQINRVEELFVTRILKPKCTEILSQRGNIIALLEEIEEFLNHCPLIVISRKIHLWPWVSRYDFITNGLFPYVIQVFVKQFPHVWSPSNPDQFFTNWKRCELFIQNLEDFLPSKEHLIAFRNSSTLLEFISKWQFNVYFQLRFHNLAVELEAALDYLVTSPCATPDFKLDATRILVNIIDQCWDADKMFIVQLTGRFLKASALFIARYLKEVSTKINNINLSKDNSTSVSKSDFGETSASTTSAASAQMVSQIHQLINIYYDVNLSEMILTQILNEKFETVISSQLVTTLPTKIESSKEANPTLVNFMSQFPWISTKQAIDDQLKEIVLSQMIIHITSVNEVPRLFRRTNRDIPATHSDYVGTMLLPLQTFNSIIISQYDSNHKLSNVIGDIGIKLCHRYANQVQEVLTSVQRMEESLKRLKKVKTGGNEAKITTNNNKMSDDDKIRKQIQIDVEYLISQAKQLCNTIETHTLEKLLQDNNLTSL